MCYGRETGNRLRAPTTDASERQRRTVRDPDGQPNTLHLDQIATGARLEKGRYDYSTTRHTGASLALRRAHTGEKIDPRTSQTRILGSLRQVRRTWLGPCLIPRLFESGNPVRHNRKSREVLRSSKASLQAMGRPWPRTQSEDRKRATNKPLQPGTACGETDRGSRKFPPRQVANFVSEVLVLGLPDENGDVVLVQPERRVPDGVRLF